MNTSQTIINRLSDHPFSYGETLSIILDNKGKSVLQESLQENFIFPDGSSIQLTNQGIHEIFLLEE